MDVMRLGQGIRKFQCHKARNALEISLEDFNSQSSILSFQLFEGQNMLITIKSCS